MGRVMAQLKQMEKSSSRSEVELSSEPGEATPSKLLELIGEYYTQGHERNIHVLSLDGGGTRSHMSIKVLCQLITDIYLPDIKQFDPTNAEHKERFVKGQSDFINEFDYLVGTSTGGLIAFCLAIKYDLFHIKDIYEDAKRYFKPQGYTRFGVFLKDKYDPTPIYKKIDEIIGKIKVNGKQLTAEDATLLDIHNLLNPNCTVNDDTLELYSQSHSNSLEFVDDRSNPPLIEREKVLLITAYNTTSDSMTIFNTSYADHWGYRIADVLKATMAAPTYFPPCTMYKRKLNNHLERDGSDETFVDGGVFANDPELAALWAIQMQWKKPINCRLISIGTGCYNAKVSVDNWRGGYWYWLIQTNGLLVNMFMDGTHSLTETIMKNLSKFDNIKRIKFNYKLKKSMELDDPNFATMFNEEWENLKTENDYLALVYFYQKYIQKNQN